MLLVAFLIKSINQINFYIEELLILLKTCFRNSWFIMKSIGQRDTSFFPIICCLPQTDLYMCQKIWEEPEESMPVSHHMNGNFMHLKGAKRTFVLLLLHHYQQGTIPEISGEMLGCTLQTGARYCVCSLLELFEISWNHVNHFPLSVAFCHQVFFPLLLTTFVHHVKSLGEFRNYFF